MLPCQDAQSIPTLWQRCGNELDWSDWRPEDYDCDCQLIRARLGQYSDVIFGRLGMISAFGGSGCRFSFKVGGEKSGCNGPTCMCGPIPAMCLRICDSDASAEGRCRAREACTPVDHPQPMDASKKPFTSFLLRLWL